MQPRCTTDLFDMFHSMPLKCQIVQEHRFCQELAGALKLRLHWLLLERI